MTLSVRDRGCGMTEEVRARIFEPFFTTKETGTGLGLATVYGIVRQAGGAIRVETRAGAGDHVHGLPARGRGAGAARGPARSRRRRRAGWARRWSWRRTRTACARCWGGCWPAAATRWSSGRNGAEALEAARARGGRVDLLLADLVMPRMNGAELAEALSETQPGLKVLFMTGHTDGRAGARSAWSTATSSSSTSRSPARRCSATCDGCSGRRGRAREPPFPRTGWVEARIALIRGDIEGPAGPGSARWVGLPGLLRASPPVAASSRFFLVVKG